MKIGSLAVLYVFLVSCALMIGAVDAVAQTFKVSAGEEVVKTVDLHEGGVVSGRVNVVGGQSNEIKFYITDPDGTIIVWFENAGATNFGFTASKTGTYSLHFDNTLSEWDKTVSLNYEVRYYIFGMPQELFYAFVVVLIGVVGVMVYVALART